MKVEENKVISLEFTMTDDKGEVLDSSLENGPFVFIKGTNSIVPGLEDEVNGKSIGDQFDVTLKPEEAFGEIDKESIMTLPKDDFKDINAELEIGMELEMADEEDPEQSYLVAITEITENDVTINGNHPLAGITLRFVGKVSKIREATAEELEHGHVHDDDDECC